jgi:hypothetical protein
VPCMTRTGASILGTSKWLGYTSALHQEADTKDWLGYKSALASEDESDKKHEQDHFSHHLSMGQS